jgi:hypothetical protein
MIFKDRNPEGNYLTFNAAEPQEIKVRKWRFSLPQMAITSR